MNNIKFKASRDQVAKVRNSEAYTNAKDAAFVRAGGKSELSGKGGKLEAHHIRDVEHHLNLACDVNNIIYLTHDEHRAYHEFKAYDKNNYTTIRDVVDEVEDFNKFVKVFKANGLSKRLAIIKRKDANIKALRKANLKTVADREAAIKSILKVPASLYEFADDIKFNINGRMVHFKRANYAIQIRTADVRVCKNIRAALPQNAVQINTSTKDRKLFDIVIEC